MSQGLHHARALVSAFIGNPPVERLRPHGARSRNSCRGAVAGRRGGAAELLEERGDLIQDWPPASEDPARVEPCVAMSRRQATLVVQTAPEIVNTRSEARRTARHGGQAARPIGVRSSNGFTIVERIRAPPGLTARLARGSVLTVGNSFEAVTIAPLNGRAVAADVVDLAPGGAFVGLSTHPRGTEFGAVKLGAVGTRRQASKPCAPYADCEQPPSVRWFPESAHRRSATQESSPPGWARSTAYEGQNGQSHGRAAQLGAQLGSLSHRFATTGTNSSGCTRCRSRRLCRQTRCARAERRSRRRCRRRPPRSLHAVWLAGGRVSQAREPPPRERKAIAVPPEARAAPLGVRQFQ